MTDQGGLLVPVRDIDGRLHSLQYITRVSKAFLKNSRKSGCMHVIDPNRYLGKGSYGNVGQMTECSNTACRKVQTPVVLNPAHQAKALKRFGGARRDRTDDLLLAKQALSQLSYGPINSAASDGDLLRSHGGGETAASYLRMAAAGQPLFSD